MEGMLQHKTLSNGLHSSNTGEKWEYNGTVHQLFMVFRKACDSVRWEVLYNILTEFDIPLELIRLIKMCLNETCSKFCLYKHLLDAFPVQNGLKQGDALSPLLFNFALEQCSSNGGPRTPGVCEARPRGLHDYLIVLFSSNEKACEMSSWISSQRRGTSLKSKMT
jgi:hypothetical protein